MIMKGVLQDNIFYLNWATYTEQNWAKLKSVFCPPLLPYHPYSHGCGMVLRPLNEDGTHLCMKEDDSKWNNFNEILDFYPKCAGEGRGGQCGPVCSPRRDVSYSTTPTILSMIFFFIIIKKCGLVEKALRVALTCSMEVTFDKSLSSVGLRFPKFKMRG